MNANLLGLLLLLAACGQEPAGARLEPRLRQLLGESAAMSSVAGSAEAPIAASPIAPDAAWICTDPVSLSLAKDEGRIHVHGRAVEHGGAGVLVDLSGGDFEVTARIRIDRLELATGIQIGLARLGGVVRQQRDLVSDPHASLGFFCGGGEGDLRLDATFCACGDAPMEPSALGPFSLGERLECRLAGKNGRLTATLRQVDTNTLRARAAQEVSLPPALYLFGCLPRTGDGCVLDAVIDELTFTGGAIPLPANDHRIPACLRGGVLAFLADPLADDLTQIARGTDWAYLVATVFPRLQLLDSLMAPCPGLRSSRNLVLFDGWRESAALRLAPDPLRQSLMVGPLCALTAHALDGFGPLPEALALLGDWQDARLQLDLRPVRRAAALALLARTEARPAPTLELALQACASDYLAGLLFEQIEDGAPLPPSLLEFAGSPAADPRLAADVATAVAARGQPELARQLAERAFAGGVCDADFAQLLERLQEEPLLDSLHENRMEGMHLLTAWMRRAQWMGLAGTAQASARVLLQMQVPPSDEVLGEVLPVLIWAYDRDTLSGLLRDPKVLAKARDSLRDDPLLAELRAGLLEELVRN